MTSRPSPVDDCPCGSGDRLGSCCGPVLDGEPAVTAEAVMRSRYTAFAVGDRDHLLRTWHPRTRPADVAVDPGTQWAGLVVQRTEGGGVDDVDGVVEFTATYRNDGAPTVHELHEVSQFVRRGGRWVYVAAVGPGGR